MLERLRTATRDEHAHLEAELGLLEPPLSQMRFTRILLRFYAFHRAWEPRIEALIGDGDFLQPRRRLAHLQRDLDALGMAASPPESVPELGFLSGAAAAWGSLYVIEGSTLGGLVISKSLRAASWAPEGGLSYFNPYGRGTAAMWKAFGERLAYEARSETNNDIVTGAVSTFRTLRAWFRAYPEPQA